MPELVHEDQDARASAALGRRGDRHRRLDTGQKPHVLPGLTIDQAAATRSTLLAVVIAVVCGAIMLVPAPALLFGLVLRGRCDPTPTVDATVLTPPQLPRSGQTHLLPAVAAPPSASVPA